MRILSANGRCKTKLPRKGILMAVKVTHSRFAQTRAIVTPVAAGNAVDEFSQRVDEVVQGFRGQPASPQRFLELENALQAAAAETCRQILELPLGGCVSPASRRPSVCPRPWP